MENLMALVPLDSQSLKQTICKSTRWDKAVQKPQGSRFGPVDDRPYLPPSYIDVPPGLLSCQLDQFLREQRYDDLLIKLTAGEVELPEPDIRPPSPPPIYDSHGNRTNTQDIRVRTSMNSEYNRLIEFLLVNVNGFSPPTDYKPLKKIRKIIIPLDEFPDYNFMGLIIGPRGCNHKRLEAESGTQISVRGRGTQKEGKRSDHQTDEEANMPMHVHISADSDEKLEKAVSLVEPLLDPFHSLHEDFKKRGLEQLALVNGINLNNKMEMYRCSICSGTGHLAVDCPDNKDPNGNPTFVRPNIRCAICGDMGHVTMDCKFGRDGVAIPIHILAENKHNIDQEYNQMMSELTGKASSIVHGSETPHGSATEATLLTPPPGITPPPPFITPPGGLIRPGGMVAPPPPLGGPPIHSLYAPLRAPTTSWPTHHWQAPQYPWLTNASPMIQPPWNVASDFHFQQQFLSQQRFYQTSSNLVSGGIVGHDNIHVPPLPPRGPPLPD